MTGSSLQTPAEAAGKGQAEAQEQHRRWCRRLVPQRWRRRRRRPWTSVAALGGCPHLDPDAPPRHLCPSLQQMRGRNTVSPCAPRLQKQARTAGMLKMLTRAAAIGASNPAAEALRPRLPQTGGARQRAAHCRSAVLLILAAIQSEEVRALRRPEPAAEDSGILHCRRAARAEPRTAAAPTLWRGLPLSYPPPT